MKSNQSRADLRNQLFAQYFKVEDGILATDFVDKLSFLPKLWKRLHVLCEKHIQYFDSLSTLKCFKLIEYQKKKYLILKVRMFKYVIIDIEKMENITEEQFRNDFNEDFFCNYFGEIKRDQDFFRMYDLLTYDGNVQELIDFYSENKDLLCLSTSLHYRLEIGAAWTYFCIDFVNASAQMGFQTKDQFLYEHLLLRYDLMPLGTQDAPDRIGIEKMQEMFARI
ncbi:MAG: hypothetical protein HFI09_04545, partial [Bacilli bacterium]|nr:hypothetical protein [Bacilli bacterium]